MSARRKTSHSLLLLLISGSLTRPGRALVIAPIFPGITRSGTKGARLVARGRLFMQMIQRVAAKKRVKNRGQGVFWKRNWNPFRDVLSNRISSYISSIPVA